MAISSSERRDVVWQRADTTRNYHHSRQAIPYADAHFDIAERVLRAHSVNVRHILDLGCGDGIATAEMCTRFTATHAVLLDFSEPMLKAARTRFNGKSPDVTFVAGDLLGDEWLPEVEEMGPYDLVISRFAIHHLPHARKRSLYGEVLDLLRPGGMFVNIEHVASVNDQYQTAFERSLIEGIHALSVEPQTLSEVEAAFHARQDAETNILAPVELQLQWLRECGFIDVDCAFKALELSVFAGRRPRA